jgi:hypothetical protein
MNKFGLLILLFCTVSNAQNNLPNCCEPDKFDIGAYCNSLKKYNDTLKYYSDTIINIVSKLSATKYTVNKDTKLRDVYVSAYCICPYLNELLRTKEISQFDCSELTTVNDCIKIVMKTLRLKKPKDICDKEEKTKDWWDESLNWAGDHFNIAANEDGTSLPEKYREPASYINIIQENDNKKIANVYLGFDLAKVLIVFSKIFPNPNLNIKAELFGDYHIDNTLEPKRDIMTLGFKTGLSYLINKENVKPRIDIDFTFAYSHNIADTIYSPQTWKQSSFLTITSEWNNPFGFILPRKEPIGYRPSEKFELLAFMYQPSFGFEYVQEFNLMKGHTWAFVYKNNIKLFFVERFLQLNADIQRRNIFTNTLTGENNAFDYNSFSLNLIIIGNNLITLTGVASGVKMGFGVTYEEGENPWSGFTKKVKRTWAIKVSL